MSKKFQMYYTTSRLKVHLIIRNEAGKSVGLKTVPLSLIEDEHGMLSSATAYTHVIDGSSPLSGLTSANVTEHVAKFSLIVQGDESMGFATTYVGNAQCRNHAAPLEYGAIGMQRCFFTLQPLE